jgi:mono/diheme cytochrome c family protein
MKAWLVPVVLVGAAAACTSEPRAVTDLRAAGHDLFFGRAGCAACHRVGDEGTRIVGPNLGRGDGIDAPVAARRRTHLPPIEYVVESIVEPDAFVVPGYARGVMPRQEEPPVALTDDEIVALAVFLSRGGPAVDEAAIAAARARIAAVRTARSARASAAPPRS